MKEKKSQTILLSTWENVDFNLYIPVIRDKDNKPFVYFNFLNPETNKKKKIVKSVGLDRNGDVKTLRKQGRELVENLVELLSGGWNPISGTFNDLPITPLSSITDCMNHWLKTREESVTINALSEKSLQSNKYLMDFFYYVVEV